MNYFHTQFQKYLMLDMYGSVFGQSPMVDDCFAKLKKRIKAEVELQQQLFSMMVVSL